MGKILKTATIATIIIVLTLIGYLSVYYISDSKKEPIAEEQTQDEKDVEIKPLDKDWNLYINHNLGFSIKIPKNFSGDDFEEKWQIVVARVNNDEEIDDFIKSEMSKIGVSACSMGDKISARQSGVFDIEIKGDGKNPEESNCWVNFAYVLKYYPAKNKIAYWFLGQEPTFHKEGGLDSYDGEMIDSFEFIN